MDSFRYALAGLCHAFVSQRNFRVHLAIGLAAIGVSWWLRICAQSWALLALTIGVVLVVELLNSAAEMLVDLVTPDYHPLAKAIKDLMAGAVLVAALISIIVGVLILGPSLLARLGLG